MDKKTILEALERVARRTTEMEHGWGWPSGVAFYGLAEAGRATGNEAYIDFLKEWTDDQIERGLPPLNVNAAAVGHALLALHQRFGGETYLGALQTLLDYLTRDALRFGDGVLQHTVSADDDFPEQAWADTLFMAGLVLVRAGLLLENEAYINDGLKQFYWHIRFLQDEKTNLFYHAWDNRAENHLSGVYWARANAWCAVTLSECIRASKVSFYFNPLFMELIDGLRDQLAALTPLQREDGLWSTVLDDPAAYTETSASCGIALGMLNNGGARYAPCVEKAAAGVLARVRADGMVDGVSSGTAVMYTAADYKAIPNRRLQGWGQGLALAFLARLYEECAEE
jgi:unsaturated rhamnogalacturonyl hydrolase